MDVVLEKLKTHVGQFSVLANFEVPDGITAVIGPSGGGKSSLLLGIAGFADHTEGALLFDALDLSGAAPAARPVTLLFQEHNLFPHLSVFQNTGIGLRSNLKFSDVDNEAIDAALGKVGLSGFAARVPSELSGGQRQRVALARALLRRKPLLMLDEPFAALGPALRYEMLDLVQEIALTQGFKVLMVTHNPEDALRIAGNTILVADGFASQPEPTQTFFEDPPAQLRAYLGK